MKWFGSHHHNGPVDAREAYVRSQRQYSDAHTTRQLLQSIIDSSDDAIISKSLDGTITSWNLGAEKLFGYSPAEAIGQTMQMLIPPERATEEQEILHQIAAGNSIGHFETVRVKKDGSRIEISTRISPIKDAMGHIVGASKIARDITERRRSDLKLAAQLSRLNLLDGITRATGERQDLVSIFRTVTGTLEDQLPLDFGSICSVDASHRSLTVSSVGLRSQGIVAALALPEGALLAVDDNGLSRCVRGELVYEPDTADIPFAFAQRLAAGGLRSLVIAPLWVESQIFGILIAARRAPQAFSSGECEFLKQVAEHTALAARQADLFAALTTAYEDLRLTQQAVMQQERLRVLGQMASGIAHDINNAISPITLYTDFLLEKDPSLSENARECLLTIQQSVGDVASTVARLREFYREREPMTPLVPVNLNGLARQVIDLTRARWNDMPLQRGTVIQTVTDFNAELPAVLGAENEIREALTNLIFNAVDAMPHGGTLTLRTCVLEGKAETIDGRTPEWVCLEISDTGIGMDEPTRRRCLEPFFSTKGERGTGLGLAMVYGALQRHGANLEIDSVLGSGTTVRLGFSVPAADTTPVAVLSPVFVVPTNLRLLIIDDDPLLLKSLTDTLIQDGHSVVAASGGRAGIDAVAAARVSGEAFSAVITDLGMPYFDGRKVAAAVKMAAPATPVIMLTGWGQRLQSENDIPPHVDRLLSKPPRLNVLRAALAELTGGHSS